MNFTVTADQRYEYIASNVRRFGYAKILCHCPECGRVYWRGSHYKRMWAKLNTWQEAKAVSSGHSAQVV